jgi:hypothetical protein
MKKEVFSVILFILVLGLGVAYFVDYSVGFSPGGLEGRNTIILEGALEVVYYDGEDTRVEYFLVEKESDKRFIFYPDEELGLLSGTRIKIKGDLSNDN